MRRSAPARPKARAKAGWRGTGRRAVLAALALAVLLAPALRPAAAQGVDLAGRTLAFRILRDGGEIGRQSVAFSAAGQALTVTTKIAIRYRFLFLTLYRFDLDSVETWRDGRLIALATGTEDNGEHYRVRARRDGDGVAVEGPEGVWRAPADVVPSSLWHRAMVGRSPLLSVRRGDPLAVRYRLIGRETIDVGGRPLRAEHVRVEGGLERDLWFADDGLLVRIRFEGDDGSEIVFALE